MNEEIKSSVEVKIQSFDTNEHNLLIGFDKSALEGYEKVSLLLKMQNSKDMIRIGVGQLVKETGQIQFDMSDIKNHINKLSKSTWQVYFEIENAKGAIQKRAIQSNFEKKNKRNSWYFNRSNQTAEPLFTTIVDGEDCVVYPLMNDDGQLDIITIRDKNYLSQIVMSKMCKATVKKGIFKVKIEYPKSPYPFKKILLLFRTKKAEDKCEYTFDIDKIKEKKDVSIIEASIDLSKIAFKPTYWDIQFIVTKDGKEYRIDTKNKSQLNYLKYCSIFNNNYYKLDDGMFVFPYLTRGRSTSLQYRKMGEYDGLSFKLKERISLIRYAFEYFWLKNKKIYLVYEKFSYSAQDNSYYFFKYCMDNHVEEKIRRKIYYIIDKNSPDYDMVRPYQKNVIHFMSIKHITYMLAARLLISTDTKTHAYAWRKRGSLLELFFKRKRLVFLQHGVTAFKKVDFLYGKGNSGECSLFVATSDFEKKIVADNFNYKNNEIAVTGFARWDVFNDKSENSKEIILMPTWRNWLEETSDEEFKKSNYYLNYMKLLQTKRLHEVLEKYDLTMNFYLHPKFKEYISNFVIDVKRIRFIPFGEEPLNELMMKCRMLITDYSSVAWDTYYLRKPVVFYQFDLDEYNETHGSYIDMKKDLFGERVEEVNPLIDLIEEYATSNFQLKQKYLEMHGNYFKFIDNDNSKRIVEHLIKKGW